MKALTCIEISEDGECLGEEGESIEEFVSNRFFLVIPKKCQEGFKLGPKNKCRKVIKSYNIKNLTKLTSTTITVSNKNP